MLSDVTALGAYQINHVWAVTFKSAEAMAAGEQEVKGRRCLVVDPQDQQVRLKLHWLLHGVGVEDEDDKGSTTRAVTLKLKAGLTVEDFPHQIRVADAGCVRTYANVTGPAGREEISEHLMVVAEVEAAAQAPWPRSLIFKGRRNGRDSKCSNIKRPGSGCKEKTKPGISPFNRSGHRCTSSSGDEGGRGGRDRGHGAPFHVELLRFCKSRCGDVGGLCVVRKEVAGPGNASGRRRRKRRQTRLGKLRSRDKQSAKAEKAASSRDLHADAAAAASASAEAVPRPRGGSSGNIAERSSPVPPNRGSVSLDPSITGGSVDSQPDLALPDKLALTSTDALSSKRAPTSRSSLARDVHGAATQEAPRQEPKKRSLMQRVSSALRNVFRPRPGEHDPDRHKASQKVSPSVAAADKGGASEDEATDVGPLQGNQRSSPAHASQPESTQGANQ
ncbi:uncharacterized protein LOC144152498 [Haemaphysalis longicornis]